MKIAVVGIAFRLPGGICDEQTFWQVLENGMDVVTEIPSQRWGKDCYGHPKRKEPGKSVTWSAGVLDQVEAFDAAFFGISPREANNLDPQQRLLLELTWEALENGGQQPEKLAGSDCAVYLGISGTDYGLRSIDDLSSVDAYSMTGNTLSIAANRISYVFDLHGPSMAIDTACSSAIVALHQACKSLAQGEASMAIAGGVNMLLHPYPFVGFTKASMISSRGRCRAFDASGDGYVRSEGAGILFLKPLEQAEADGDRIHAVILASGVNSDGSKNGITIPSIQGQSTLLQATCQRAGVSPDDLVYVEAHGTGTAVGDPIETAAIGEAVAKKRSPGMPPLLIGSVKTNVGHLESASGMAGLIKTVLCLKHRALPPSLHMQTPNPNIDFAGLGLKVVTEYTPLPQSERPLRMGVNSFGFGGANGHVLLEEYVHEPEADAVSASSLPQTPPLIFSARSQEALMQSAGRYVQWIDSGKTDYYDLAYAAAMKRQWLNQRVAVTGRSAEEVLQRARDFAAGQAADGVVREDALGADLKVAFVYSGNGAQWLGMGRALLEQSIAFRQTLAKIDALFEPLAHFSLIAELQAEESASRLQLTEVAQPALFAIQVAVTCLLRDQGVRDSAALGHSVGEVAAAWATGALTLEQAVRVIHERSAAQARTQGMGKMAAVSLSVAQVHAELERLGLHESLEVAAINSPHAVTLSGDLADLQTLQQELAARGVFFRILDLDYAFHSRRMDVLQAPLLANLHLLAPCAGTGRFISTVTGDALSGEALGAEYWWHNIRQPVQFQAAVTCLLKEGYRLFVEISPHAIMQRYLNECFTAHGVTARTVATLKRGNDGWARFQEALFSILLLGGQCELAHLFPVSAKSVELPAYPWQRERYWYNLTEEGYNLVGRTREHPLLGYRLKDAEASWENHLDTQLLPYLLDHVVGGAVVFPASGYVEMALAASRAWFGTDRHEIESLEIRAPIVFDGEHARSVRFELSPADGAFQIKSKERLAGEEWRLNVVGRLVGEPLGGVPQHPSEIPTLAETEWTFSSEAHYALASQLGLEYGPAFQGVRASRIEEKSVLARIDVPFVIREELAGHVLHPAILDACFQSLFDAFHEEVRAGGKVTLLPVGVGRLRCFMVNGEVAYCHSQLKKRSPRSAVADFWLLDAAGKTVALLENCRFRGAALSRQEHALPSAWGYRAILKPAGLQADIDFIPMNADLVSHAKAALVREETVLRRAEHQQRYAPLLDAVSVAFIHETLLTLASPQGILSAQQIAAQCAESSPQRAWFEWALHALEQAGAATAVGSDWSLGAAGSLPASQDIWLTVLGENPAYSPDLVLAGRTGQHLRELLEGTLDLEKFSQAQRGSAVREQYFDASPTYTGINRAAEHVVVQLAGLWPANRRIRILDISEGQCSLARTLLASLPVARCDYVLASTDESATARAEAELGHHACVSFLTLVAETLQLPAPKEGEAACFDIVLLGHVLHHATALHQALAGVRQRLCVGGLLVLLEREPGAAADLVLGCEPQWWRVGDDGGRVSSLMGHRQWMQLLRDGGFDDIAPLHEPAALDESGGVFAVLAKAATAEQAIAEGAQSVVSQPEMQLASWLLLADHVGESAALAAQLAQSLQRSGQRVLLAHLENPSGDEEVCIVDVPQRVLAGTGTEHMAVLLGDAVTTLGGCDHVVHLLGLRAQQEGDTAMDIPTLRCVSALHLTHALESAGLPAQPKLWLVTQGGAVLSTDPDGVVARHEPAQAALWGFARVLMNEHPDLRCTLIDIQTELNAALAGTLQRELLTPDDEDEIILGCGVRHAMRMVPFDLSQPEESAPRNAVAHACLDFSMPGQLKNLYWRALPEQGLLPDQIEIEPKATGLNFRDVMYAMGLLSDEAVENGFAGATLGMELAGVVTRVGATVEEFRVGDAVVAFAPACFASRVVTQAASAARKPEAWTFAEAATVPTVFFTVYYALHSLARLQPGEKVLIHGAAGGVGIAAIQVARYLGAEIFATAGSDEKRDFVRLLGADHVMNSRTLAYADDIMNLTGGQGIDVVLNSLAGEAINRNFRVLRPFGRFLELGKRDFYENTKIGLRPFKDNITYYGIDADQLMVERPALASSLFREVMALFEEGALRPLPYRAFPAERIIDAFRYMQQSRQIGKVVVTFDEMPSPLPSPESVPPSLALSREATYVVTGGVGGFGQRTARWLAEQGAGHLVLLSRRGADAPGAVEARAELEALGASVHFRACDVTDAVQVTRLIHEISVDMPPLKGIVHAAMVLDDGLIRNLDQPRFLRAMAPKIEGAWNLHRATQHRPLDFFVLYSSATTFIGNPGQANYVAANLYLESLAAQRRAQGLPATCVAWGAIADVGYLARNEDIKDALQSRLGGDALASDRALRCLGALMRHRQSGVAVIDFDWHTLNRFLPAMRSPRFDELRRTAGQGSQEGGSGEDIRALLANRTADEAQGLIRELLLDEVAAILRLPKDRIDVERSLYDLGMDSLMGVELVLGIEKRFGISLPVMALTEGPTIKRISERLVTSLLPGGAGEGAPGQKQDTLTELVTSVAAQHAVEVSADEVAVVVAELQAKSRIGSLQ